MTGSLRAGSMTGEQWVFEERTTDPATTLEGERWLRTDLAPKTNQIATLRVDVGSSVVNVPVFATGTSESGVNEALRLRVGGQDGYIPITTTADASFNNLRMQHGGSTLAFHDSVSTASAIPDSAISQYHVFEGSGTTFNNEYGSQPDATANGGSWVSDSSLKDGFGYDLAAADEIQIDSHYGFVSSGARFSLAFTVNMDDLSANQVIWQQSDGSNYIFVVGTGTNGSNLAAAIWEGSYVAKVSTSSATTNRLRLGVRFDSQNDTADIFIDGSDSGDGTDRPSGGTSNENVIGRRKSDTSYGAAMILDNPTWYDSLLTDQEFLDDYNAQPWS